MKAWRRRDGKVKALVVDRKEDVIIIRRNHTILQTDGIQEEKGKRRILLDDDSSPIRLQTTRTKSSSVKVFLSSSSSSDSDSDSDLSSQSDMEDLHMLAKVATDVSGTIIIQTDGIPPQQQQEKGKRKILDHDSSSSTDPIRLQTPPTKSSVKVFLSSSDDSSSSSSSSSEDDDHMGNSSGYRLSISEKGKNKVIEESSSSSSSDTDLSSQSDMEDLHMLAKVAARKQRATTMGFRERFRDVAKRNASRFALFSHQNQLQLPQTEDNGYYVEDGPTPFSTASKLIRERSHSLPLTWVPKVSPKRIRVAPSLSHLCMLLMVEYSDAITSFETVPNELKQELTHLLCASGKLNNHFFDQLVTESPYDMRIRDCSQLKEDQFTKTLQRIDTSNLKVLQLDQCGRCLPDFVLFTTLAHLPSKFSALTSISVKGACRLSDAGLNALVSSAPALTSINLGCCSLLTPDGIINLADKLGPVLKELYIDDCCGIDDKRILPALMKLQHLEVLSMSRLETVDDSFIIKFVAVHGQKMKELVLAACTKLTDRAVKAIAENCPRLSAMDLTNLHKLTDNAIRHLANGCQEIQTMKFCRNAFSDEAVAAYLEVCGKPLRELSLNHVNKVSLQTALSLAKCAKNLQTLDLSWCRDMTNETLGLILASCLSLKLLKLFGCTQIKNVFTDGHSNKEVQIIGLKQSQLLKSIEVSDPLPLRYSSARIRQT